MVVDRMPAKGDAFQLLLVGDCMLGRGVNQALNRQPAEFPWGNTLPLFGNADGRICNLECVLSDRGAPWSEYYKAFHFQSAGKNVAVLTAAGIHAVSIANNHALDYGYDALEQMLEILDGAHIAHGGAGANLAHALQIARFEIQGRRFGLLAFTDNEPPWEATGERAGVLYIPVTLEDPRAQNLLNIIRGRKDLDTLIVSAHWGSNWGHQPPQDHIRFGHALIDAGADVIFGHSSHVFRGIEFYKNRAILYSTGNFVDDYAVDPIERNDQSFIFMLELDASGPTRLRLHPTMIDYCQARLARKDEAEAIAAKMQELCSAFGTPTRWNPEQQVLEISVRAAALDVMRRR
jgi:poly-gamma-glutamate capsule biosynthesis protein CapA/YwtB (metallophosphatase superfamily)